MPLFVTTDQRRGANVCKLAGRQRSMERSKDEGQPEPAAGDSSRQDTEAPPHWGDKVTSLELKATEITGEGHCTPRISSDMDVW